MVHWRRTENRNILNVFKASQWNFWAVATIHHNLQKTQIFLPHMHTLIFNLGIQITCTQNRWSTTNGVKGFLAYCKFLLEQRVVRITELPQNTTKEVKSIYITHSSFSFILSIKQDCMGMATNSQTSKCKVLHENGSIPLSITVCVQIYPYLSLFCATVWCCKTILIV